MRSHQAPHDEQRPQEGAYGHAADEVGCPYCGRPYAARAGLTPRQRDCLKFISSYIAENSCSPSYNEIRAGIGLHSKSGVNRLVSGLVARGFIGMLPHRTRSLYLIEDHPSSEVLTT